MRVYKLITLLIIITLIIIGCKPSPKNYDKNPLTVIVPKEVPQNDISKIVCDILENIGWTIVSSKEGEIIAVIERANRHGKVRLTYNDKIIVIGNESTAESIETNNPSAKPRTIRFVPYGWLMNIKNRVSNKFLKIIYKKQ